MGHVSSASGGNCLNLVVGRVRADEAISKWPLAGEPPERKNILAKDSYMVKNFSLWLNGPILYTCSRGIN